MRICIVSPNKQAYSETFIKAHIERLKDIAGVLYGGHLPTHIQLNDEPLLGLKSSERIKRLLAQKVSGRSLKDLQRDAIATYLKDNSIDLILAEYGPTGVEMLEVAIKSRIPLVVHFHGVDAYHNDIIKNFGDQYHELFDRVAAVVCVSRHMEGQLLELGAKRETLHCNPYGVNVARFDGGNPYHSGVAFVGIGRFTEKKAPYLTIMAFAKVLREIPEARLTLIGDGPLLDPCRKIIKALHLEEQIDLPGVLSSEKIAARLKKARAFVQHSLVPSNNDHEGTPLAVIEACSTGLPVISTEHAGIPDVVEHGVSGLLCVENNIDKMTEHMILLARDPELAGRMGMEARRKVLAEYTLEKSIGSLQSILLEALSKAQ